MSGGEAEPDAPRATIDTNLFISGLIGTGAPKRLLEAWDRGKLRLVLSDAMLAEIGDVLRRPRIRDRYGVTEQRVQALERGFVRYAEVVKHLGPIPGHIVVRDPKDEHVLQTALTGSAEYLVTGDEDILALSGVRPPLAARIVTVNEFLEAIARRPE